MSSKTIYVGFTGLAGAGKDYVADLLIKKLWELDIATVPWARGVRDEIARELGAQIGNVPTLYEKPTTPAVRRLLQWWGTDFRRAQDPDYWVNWGLASAEKEDADVVFFTDTRFMNEVDAITENGGIVINVTASQTTRENRIGPTPAHASEDLAAYLPFHLRVPNDIMDMEPDLNRAIEMLLGMARKNGAFDG